MANKAIDKSYLLQTLKDFNTKILLMFFQKKLTVTTVPSDPGNGDVIIYVGSTSGNFVQGHTYKYNTSQTSWVDITATGSYSTGDALALNIDGVDTLPFYDSSALSTKRITWLNIISIIKSAFGTAAQKNIPASGDASSTEVVMGDDSRLTDARTPTTHTHTTSQITDLPTLVDELADLSDTTITNPTDGQVLAYDDASDKWINSSQQAVNNATLTIKRNGADVATFSSNASVDVTADIAVPAIINNLMAQYPGKALDATQGKTLKDRTDLNPHWFFRYGSFSKDVPIRFPETGSHGIFSDSYGCQIFPMCDSDANGRPRKFKSVVVYPQEYCELTPAEDILSSYIGLLVFSRPVNSQWATADDAVN